VETVHSQYDVGNWISIAVDGQDRPRISYEYNYYGDLYCAWYDEPQGVGQAAYGLGSFSLAQPVPNPSFGTSTIGFTVSQRGSGTLAVSTPPAGSFEEGISACTPGAITRSA
jgi:hypothetical protein